MEKITRYYDAARHRARRVARRARYAKKAELAGAIALCPPSALQDLWSRRFPDPVTAFASGWMRVRARARQRGVELPLVISDHADWDGLMRDHRGDRRSRDLGDARPGRRAGALVRARGLEARPLDIVGYGDEDEATAATDGDAGDDGMNRFAELLDRLAYEPGRNNKLRLMADYFRNTPDPERGYALAALTGALSFQHAKPGMIRALIAERTDPVLFGLSYDYVGDLSETVALMWPAAPRTRSAPSPLEGEGWGGGREVRMIASTPHP